MLNRPYIVECPRDAMQGIKEFIPTDSKVAYLNSLLRVGFSTLDCGSFVSPKAIPQMKDTAQVLPQLDQSDTELLVIVANRRGAEEAVAFSRIKYLGFPLSLSETFQLRNTNKSIEQAIESLEQINALAVEAEKKVVCYLSMAFGNPYGDAYSPQLVGEFAKRIADMGISIISLADTIGTADLQSIPQVYQSVAQSLPSVEVGLHLHSRPPDVYSKTRAAWQSGCRRIDGALMGFGGCPMAKDELVGNMATEEILRALADEKADIRLHSPALTKSLELATHLFPSS